MCVCVCLFILSLFIYFFYLQLHTTYVSLYNVHHLFYTRAMRLLMHLKAISIKEDGKNETNLVQILFYYYTLLNDMNKHAIACTLVISLSRCGVLLLFYYYYKYLI